jgi:hypothetical protein
MKGFYDINYLIMSYLMITCHCIYEEIDATSYMRIKLVQLIFNILKTV